MIEIWHFYSTQKHEIKLIEKGIVTQQNLFNSRLGLSSYAGILLEWHSALALTISYETQIFIKNISNRKWVLSGRYTQQMTKCLVMAPWNLGWETLTLLHPTRGALVRSQPFESWAYRLYNAHWKLILCL